MSFSVLPNELVMEFFTWLPLKALIAAQGVNRQWRHLLPLSNLLPARKALLALYLDAVEKEFIPEDTKSHPDNLLQFDRITYLSRLVAKNNNEDLPEEFRVWILEWPCIVMGWMWPGHINFPHPKKDTLGRKCLTYHISGQIMMWLTGFSKSWLVTRDRGAGKYIKGTVRTRSEVTGKVEIASSWVAWLTEMLHKGSQIDSEIMFVCTTLTLSDIAPAAGLSLSTSTW